MNFYNIFAIFLAYLFFNFLAGNATYAKIIEVHLYKRGINAYIALPFNSRLSYPIHMIFLFYLTYQVINLFAVIRNRLFSYNIFMFSVRTSAESVFSVFLIYCGHSLNNIILCGRLIPY